VKKRSAPGLTHEIWQLVMVARTKPNQMATKDRSDLFMRQNDEWQNDWYSENHFAIHHSAKRNGLRPVRKPWQRTITR